VANLLEKLTIKHQKSLSGLFSVYSVVIPIVLGIVMTCLTGLAVYWVSDHAFNQAHQNWVDMFTENIRQDMVKGNHSEVFRKCKKFANESDGVVHLVIKDSFGKDVCNEGAQSASPHLIKKIYFDSSEAELVGEVEVLLEQKSRNKIVMITLGLLLFGFSILTVLLLKVGRSIQNSIIEPFVTIHHALRTPAPEGLSFINLNGKLSEIIEIESSLKFYGNEIGRLRNLEMKSESLRVLSEVASQVAHDIRSPLAALNMVSSELGEVSEEKRLLIRNSIQRINDIANDLLAKGKLNAEKIKTSSDTGQLPLDENKRELILLAPLVDGIVSEKRIQYRDQINIKIDSDLKHGLGCFVKAESKDLKRILSNLVNNSVEAFPDNKGEVIIVIETRGDWVNILVKDNGGGIPQEILNQLGKAGLSYGKNDSESGSGLGIYHAKKCIEAMGGNFAITSQLGQGTEVNIQLPRAKTPAWFLESLVLSSEMEIYCLDDDLTIHQIWKSRLENIQATYKNIHINNFTSALEFKKCIQVKKSETTSKDLFLIDFELLGQDTNGLEVIEQLGVFENVILVTSRYEEPEIKRRCELLNIKLLPKSLAGFVPIVIEKAKERYDWILIDDDELVRLTWKASASKHNKKFIGFKCYKDFLAEQRNFDYNSSIFIDVHLGNGVNGKDVAEKLFEDGFKKLHLATGYDADHFSKMDFIISVLGKEPPIKLG